MKLPHLNSSFKARETQDKLLSQLQKYVCSVTQALHGKLICCVTWQLAICCLGRVKKEFLLCYTVHFKR